MIEINDDETASRILTEAKQATGDEREQMADALIAYGEKKAAEEYNATDEHFAKLYTDDSYFEEINANDTALLEAVNPETTARRASNHAYLEHRFGREIPAENYDLERDAYAMANYGRKNLDDAQFFDYVAGEYNWQKQRTEAINDLQMQAVAKAINDSKLGQNRPFVDGMTEVFNEWQAKYPELVDGQNDAAFLSQGYKLYNDTINDLDTVRPQASKALSTLTAFTQGNASDEELQSLANDFVGAPPEDRQKIYKYVTLAAQAGQIDRAGLEQFAVNMGQAFTRGFDFIPQGSLQIQESGVNEVLQAVQKGQQVWVPQDGDITKATVAEKTPKAQVLGQAPTSGMFATPQDGYREATPEEADQFATYAKNAMESFKVVRELRNVAKTGVDPIRPVLEEDTFWGTAERGAYGLAGSIAPMAATAVNPYLGVLAYQATEYDRIMLENPDIDPQFAQGLALVEGAANAAIDRVQLKSLSGKLPMFGRYLDRIKSDGIRRTIKIGANVFEQNVQEGAQDLIAPVLETAVAALREDMPDKDFSALMDEWAGQRAETFFATLPLSLIGGGIATYQDIKNPSAELNATKLRQVGFDKEQVTFIQRADNPEEYTARIQMELDKRTPENIEAGRQEVLTEMQKAATPGENDARISESIAEDGTRRWVVTAPDGRELLQTKDQQAALEAVRQHSEAQLLNKQFETAYEPEELRQVIRDRANHWLSQNSVNTILEETQGLNAQQKLEQLQAAGNAAQIQELHNRIANSPFKDTPYDQINILGEASVQDVAEMVWRPLIKINPNTRPENLREEIHHIGVKIALKNNRVTLDTLRGWLEATESALPGTFQNLVRETEGDIIESLAQVQAAYEDGKINANEETKLPASFIDYIKNMMRAFAEVLRRAVALRGAFKDGILPAEYEAFLAESVGLNQQTLVDTTRERVSNEVLTDTNFSIGSKPYPMEDKGKWYSNEDFAKRGGRIVTMSPDQFLSQVRPLEVDDASRDNIDDLKNMMQSGRKLDPLTIYADGKEDGRHRAIAAKELGISSVPVIDFRQPVSTDTNFSIGNVSGVDENGIHPFAKPRPSTYANPNESEFDPSAILETLVRGKSGTNSTKRRKHGRPLASHAAFVDWAQRQNQTIGHSFFSEEQKIGSGGEHLVFSTGDRVYKLTKPGLFGIQADDAGAYLQRWALANRLFNDDARIEGIVKLPGESDYRTVVSHRHIDGRDSTRAEIQDYLQSHGFVQVESQWIHPTLGIAALDAETAGNSITMPDGTVAPVDLNLQPASPQYLQQAREQTGIGGQTSFSIASQSEIDRVNRALGGMNRGPDERLKVYERAREKFSSVLQENKDIIDAIRTNVTTDTAPALQQVEMDRASRLADIDAEENSEVAKALQDNADTFMPRIESAQSSAERKRVERDAKDRAKILEQGIRDKYAERKKLTESQAKAQQDQIVQTAQARDSASNARMRDKVRLTKMTTALGSLDAILSVLPHEIQGKVGGFTVLTKIGTGDKALADFFIKRIEMIDRELERSLKKEYGNALDTLLESTKPKKAKPGEKPTGIGADIQSMFAVVRDSRKWTPEQVDGHIANIETQIASGNLTAEKEAILTREADLVSLVGDWKNADSIRRAAALSAATETWKKGMAEFVQKKIREREERDMARAEAIKATGKKGKYTERRERDKKDNGIEGQAHGWYIDTLSWDQTVNFLFGHESPLAIRLSDGQRKAEYAKIDGIQAKEDALHDFFTKLAGGKRVDGERLMWDMSQPSIPANGLNLSELEALTATMMWEQEDGRRHMTGELDETGNPIGDWHYDQKFVDDIESRLSPEAKMIREFLWENYGTEWFAINDVFSGMNGINLPRIPKYSPVSVTPINIPSGMVADPVTGNAVSATSISPGALRNRGVAIAEPVFRNAIQTYIAHTRQMEHWKAFAPWIKEVNGILRFRKVHNAMHEASGGESSLVIGKFLDVFAQGGNRDASLTLEISKTMGGMASRAAQVALVGRVGTIAIQSTQIGAASAELPVGAYLSRLGKLLTGNLGWGDAINSKYIQRRLKQMPLTVQIAMEGLKAGKPNQLKHQVAKVGQLISGSDALWTAGTYAMVYDYQLGQAKAAGYRGQPAEEYAHNIAERITDRLAQPTRMGTRSIYELTTTNTGARLAWAFASESRKNIALLAYTKANRPLKRFLAATAGYVFFNLAMGALIRNAWKDMKDDGDDEDEYFDAKTWNWKRMSVALFTEPLQGIPLLGDYTEKGINAALGQYHQSSDLINFERGIKSFKNIPDILQGERDTEGVLKDIDGMVSLMGLFNQSAAAAASLTHIASDFFGVVDNATEE